MRAVVVEKPGPAGSLSVTETPAPSPGPGEVSVDVAYAGVGFVDTLFRAGAFELPLPFVPGIEATGYVREAGPGVTGFEPGAPVGVLLNDFGRGPRAGGYAEVAVAHASMAAVLPADADLARMCALLINGVTGWLALHDLARVTERDSVLVLGAGGGLGSITGRLAAAHGVRRVVGVFGSEARKPADGGAWTDLVLAAELEAAVAESAGADGVDVVVDPVGGDLRTRAFGLLAPFGRQVVVGNASGQDPALSGDAVWLNSRQLLGLNLGGLAHVIPERVRAALAAVVGLVHSGTVREPAPAVLPLDRAGEVHAALENRTAPAKTVLAVR
ncbi:zinc-binding alcohol dehydrogenase family protein [Streptomyces sp. 184]|uniref:quinone oxidoreductase family protein n=1 Tax=Streptomyces sp. 184 TaxID=1827526 RepID=UPI00389194B9